MSALAASSSEPNGQYQGLLLSVLATGAVAAGFKGAGAGSLAATVSEEPNGHQLPPSASFFGVCAQPVIATHRAKARVFLDDIENPQNEVMKNQSTFARINSRFESKNQSRFRPWSLY
jgi:hypothetical protein